MRLQFILSEIGHGLRRNLSMAISVILVTFVSLTFVGAAGLLQLQVNEMKDDWYDRVEVSIFLCPSGSDVTTCAGGEATQEQIDGIRAELESPAQVVTSEPDGHRKIETSTLSYQSSFISLT